MGGRTPAWIVVMVPLALLHAVQVEEDVMAKIKKEILTKVTVWRL